MLVRLAVAVIGVGGAEAPSGPLPHRSDDFATLYFEVR
jgi:hypothetical protein